MGQARETHGDDGVPQLLLVLIQGQEQPQEPCPIPQAQAANSTLVSLHKAEVRIGFSSKTCLLFPGLSADVIKSIILIQKKNPTLQPPLHRTSRMLF